MSRETPAQRPIELILLHQLASYLDMPIFVVDAEGRAQQRSQAALGDARSG
jgi:hypothetical protein